MKVIGALILIAAGIYYYANLNNNNTQPPKALASAETVYEYVQSMNKLYEYEQSKKDYIACLKPFTTGLDYNNLPDDLRNNIQNSEEKINKEALANPTPPDFKDADRLNELYLAKLKARGLSENEINELENIDFNNKNYENTCRLIIISGYAVKDMGPKDGGNYSKLLFSH